MAVETNSRFAPDYFTEWLPIKYKPTRNGFYLATGLNGDYYTLNT